MSTAIKTREIQYTAPDGSHLIGYFAAPDSETPVAGVIVAPEWWGRNEYTEQRARELAEHGYAALAIDMYGDKKVTTTAAQAYEWMMQTFEELDTVTDRMVTLEDVANFEKEMQAAEVKHEVVVLEGAKHGFSNPLADERAKANGVDLGYNSEAEKQGLAKMYALLDRTLK